MGSASSDHVGDGARVCGCVGGRATFRILGAAVLAALSLIGSGQLLKLDLPEPARLGVALLPVPFYLLMLWVMVRAGRGLDEMMVRIQFEALLMTVAASVLLLIAYGQLQKIGYLPREDMAMGIVVISFAYVVSYLAAWRRYR